ncbi:hypothetical protein [Agrobacterium cavarae]|uniref:hypothetical protein n=1 Tax=Agrobacterium cavarae TaxID=2528239 RepID=UPI0028ADE16A|nr:hypothetical protein [Agrobacterium cavarae]
MTNDHNVDFPIIRVKATAVGQHPGRIQGETGHSRFPEGFVLLFERRSGQPLTLFNYFSREVGVSGRTDYLKWKNTQKSLADDGANFATFLYLRGSSIESAKFSDLEAYAHALGVSISSVTGRRFSDSTRRRRIGTIVEFYEWAFERGWLDRVIPPRNGKLPSGLRFKAGALKSDASVRALMPNRPAADEKVRVIPRKVLPRLLRRLGPSIDKRTAYGPLARDRLVAESSLGTSARLVSLASLETVDVLNAERLIDPTDPHQLLTVPVRPKGNAPSRIIVPQAILIKWLIYYRTERAEVCRKVLECDGGCGRVSSKLFLNHATANGRDLGRAASEDTLSRAFTAAVLAEGMIRKEMVAAINEFGDLQFDTRGEIVLKEVVVPANTFHHLRHTYVVLTYHAMKRAGRVNPWKAISNALGHKLMATTIDIYGSHVEIDESGLSEAVDSFLSNLDEDGDD